jgi:hypothetical protein
MKSIIFVIALPFVLVNSIYSQETIQIIKTNPVTKQITEEYFVLKDKPEIKQGFYISYYQMSKESKSFYKEDWIRSQGFYSNSKKDSTWTYYSNPTNQSTHHMDRSEHYKNGIKIGIWSSRNEIDKSVVEQFDYSKNIKLDPIIEEYIRYPEDAKEKGIQGLVEIKVLYNPDCTIQRVDLVSNPDSSLTQEVLRFVNKKAKLLKKYGVSKDCTGKEETYTKNFILR